MRRLARYGVVVAVIGVLWAGSVPVASAHGPRWGVQFNFGPPAGYYYQARPWYGPSYAPRYGHYHYGHYGHGHYRHGHYGHGHHHHHGHYHHGGYGHYPRW